MGSLVLTTSSRGHLIQAFNTIGCLRCFNRDRQLAELFAFTIFNMSYPCRSPYLSVLWSKSAGYEYATGMNMFKMVVAKVQVVCRSRTGSDESKGWKGLTPHDKRPYQSDFYLDLIYG